MSGLIGAGADLVTILDDIARGIGSLVMLLWVLGAIGMWLAARAERKKAAAQLDTDTIAMLDAWKDKPGIIPDKLDRDLAQWLEGGGERG